MQITCQHCGVKGRIPDEKLGTVKRVRCPKCKNFIEIGDAANHNTSTPKSPPETTPSNAIPIAQRPENNKPGFKMGLFPLIINWAFGILFVLFALASMLESVKVAVVLLLISLLLLPPIRKLAFEKTGKSISTKIRAVAIIVLLFVAAAISSGIQKEKQVLYSQEQQRIEAERAQAVKEKNIQYFQSNKEQILAELTNHLNNQEYQVVLTKAKRYADANDNDLKQLCTKAKEQDLLKQVKNIPAKNLETNKKLYAELKSLSPSNPDYTEKYQYYSTKLAEQERQQRLAAEKAKKIKAQFSAWDGSHRNLERIIKENMNDPGSYEHDKTVYWEMGNYIVVMTTFRGKNAFGGVVRNSIKAKFDLDGNLIEIMK